MTHPAKDLLIAIAEGKQMENYLKVDGVNRWVLCSPRTALQFVTEDRYEKLRIARPMVERTLRYPEPLRVKPEKGEMYWYTSPTHDKPTNLAWLSDEADILIFAAGMAFATEQDAAEAHKALFGGGNE